jgi:hypothetical protein
MSGESIKDKPSQELWREGDRRPIPDPTVYTTQQLDRALAAVRELYDVRLAAMDKAVALLQATVDKSPSVAEMYAKHEQMFANIQTQFQERDIRTEQTARDSKVAVDAALQAAKEAVGEQNKSSALAIAKSEASTTKQIDQIGVTIATMEKGFDDKIGDMKDRLTLIEGHTKGIGDSWGFVIGFVGIISAVAAIIALILKH